MPETHSPESGLFVTNHLNLMFSLAAGLIMPPSGFGDKYYKDTLNEQPGWIPLFINRIPKSAINLSVEEATYLIPIIIEINLEKLECFDLNTDGSDLKQLELFGLPLTAKNRKPKSVWFVRAPISITRIRRIYAKSNDERDKILDQARLRNNVPMKPGVLNRRKTSFDREALKRWSWQPKNKRSEENASLHLAQAAGGILTMLYHVKNRSAAAAQAYTAVFEVGSQKCTIPGLSEWMTDGRVLLRSQSVEGYLLWSIVGKVAEHRDRSSDNDLDDLVLDFLEGVPEEIQYRIFPLCNTLRELVELGGSTIPEYFNLHKSPLERAIILFFMRRQCQELLEFDDEMMSDMDWAYSAILFGARSGWLRLSLESRGDEDFGDKICDWMAFFCHQIENTEESSKIR